MDIAYRMCLHTYVLHSGKLSQEKTFVNWRKIRFSQNFRRLLDGAANCAARGPHTSKFRGENFREYPQNLKFTKVFSLKSFPLYGICMVYWCVIQ